ncbi:hypothetical protein [Allochromatium warmingii]|uniref:hypothetical protein n=1 Tax=Allochromatium warmingii TaxID=61595 RepID=UPI000B883863|nr:hypothetical protein [Allochromatium warmingii]
MRSPHVEKIAFFKFEPQRRKAHKDFLFFLNNEAGAVNQKARFLHKKLKILWVLCAFVVQKINPAPRFSVRAGKLVAAC